MAQIFKDTNAVESLRNSDFDSVSAYGEVVDNAIQAEAKKIRIRSFQKEGKRGYCTFERLVFSDDGKGMDKDTLANCMTIGWSSRYNSRDGIGRFGVGMTMAAIHECKRVETYSKCNHGDWMYTYIDLDEIKAGTLDEIPAPRKKRLPRDLGDLVTGESGTIVVWSKYDRQSDNATKLLEEAAIWMGRTYRYFIWDEEISIEIDDKEVKVIDPLYTRLKKTAFPSDEPGTKYDDIVFTWPVDGFDAPEDAPKESTVKIKMSLLPEHLRPTRGSGGSKALKERQMHRNEGISILRNDREVFYGHIPYWPGAAFQDTDRWWGCEIHFDAVLDRAFEVKNIKRGAVPSKDLKKLIKKLITPTRESAKKDVQQAWNIAELEEKERKAREHDKANRAGDHESAESVVKKTPTDSHVIDEHKDFGEGVESFVQRLGDRCDEEQRAALKNLFSTQPFSIMEETWTGPQFFESHHLGGKSVLDFNIQHSFFVAVYGIIENLESKGDPYVAAKELKTLLDLLIIAYAKAETRFESSVEMSAEDFLEQLRSNWGQYLKSYVKTWRKSNPAI